MGHAIMYTDEPDVRYCAYCGISAFNYGTPLCKKCIVDVEVYLTVVDMDVCACMLVDGHAGLTILYDASIQMAR